MQIGWILRKFIPNRISGRISGWMTESTLNFHQSFKTTIYAYLKSFMQIHWILRKLIQPDIRPDIRIVTKINRDLFWHHNMSAWKFHAASYYHFWVIVWTNIRKKNPDNRLDIRSDNRIRFKFSPVLQNNIVHICIKFNANRLNIKEVHPKPDIRPDIRLDDRTDFKLSPIL